MSHAYLAIKNKHKQNQYPKLNFNKYLYNAHKPQSDDYRGSLAGIEYMDQENYYRSKKHFRDMAQSLRNQ